MDLYVSVGAADGLESREEPAGDDDPKKIRPKTGMCQKKRVTCLRLSRLRLSN